MWLALLAAAAIEAQVRAAPAPVRAFIARREGCNHWGGEEPYDRDRAREIARAERSLRCNRLEADEAALRRRFRNRADIARLLTATADRIG